MKSHKTGIFLRLSFGFVMKSASPRHHRCGGKVGEDGAFNELLLAALERLRHALQHFAPERGKAWERYLSIPLSIDLSFYLSVYFSIYLPIYLYIYLSIFSIYVSSVN